MWFWKLKENSDFLANFSNIGISNVSHNSRDLYWEKKNSARKIWSEFLVICYWKSQYPCTQKYYILLLKSVLAFSNGTLQSCIKQNFKGNQERTGQDRRVKKNPISRSSHRWAMCQMGQCHFLADFRPQVSGVRCIKICGYHISKALM